MNAIRRRALSERVIPVYQPYLAGREKDYLTRCLDTTWISHGEYVDQFEKQFASFTGAQHATSVCTGSAGLHLALLALGLGPGDEVIVPTLSHVTAANCVAQVGATPVFVDVQLDTWQMNTDDVLRKITPRTRAIVAVHLYGLACNMTALVKICKDHNLLLIEDCGDALGARYKGQHVGTFGDIASYDFYGNKTITTGEGGMVVSNQQATIDRVRQLKNEAASTTQEYWYDTIAQNYRMSNLNAAVGLAQLELARSILERKQQVVEWYKQGLSNSPVTPQQPCAESHHAYGLYSVLLEKSEDVANLRAHLKSQGIDTRPLLTPVHTLPAYHGSGTFPVAEDLNARGITLPSYAALSEQDVDYIAAVMRQFFTGKPGRYVRPASTMTLRAGKRKSKKAAAHHQQRPA